MPEQLDPFGHTTPTRSHIMTTNPARYRHRSEEVEAIQWTGTNAEALRAFCGPDFDEIDLDDRQGPDETAAVREGKHGTWRGITPGYWIVRLDGGLYEFSAADFAERYEPAPVSSAVPDRAAVRAEAFRDAAGWAAVNVHSASAEGVRRWLLGLADDELRRLAAEAQPQPACTDPIECSHEAVLGQAEEKLEALHALGTAWSRPTMSAPTRVAGEHLLRVLGAAPDGVPAAGVRQPDTETPTAALVAELERKADGWRERAFQNSQELGAALDAIGRVRQLHDQLAEETDLVSPDDPITRGSAAKRIATALDGWNPTGAPQCPVEFEGGGRCAKPAGHRPPGSDDPHVPAVSGRPAADAVPQRPYPDCERCGDSGTDPEHPGQPCHGCQRPAADDSGEEA